MEKFLAVFFSALITLSFAGCQNSETDNDNTSESSVSEKSVESSIDEPTENSVQSLVESGTESSSDNDGFDFMSYESNDVFDIGKTELFVGDANYRKSLERRCKTYEFYFLSDGYNIKAYISIPTDSIEFGKKCKCLLYNRGGRWNYGSLSADQLAFMCAATGRVVVGCEIRGGNSSEGVDKFGGEELHDVFKLIDLCEKKFSFVDMDDFCVMGESRGGMMTYMTARQDKRVKKIIVGGGISDLLSCYDEREDMQQVLHDCIGGTPEEKADEYKNRSAVYWADEIKIPVLIIHSKGDSQAKYETQAEALYEKLKDSTKCTLISHDDDYHGVNSDEQSGDIDEILKFLDN